MPGRKPWRDSCPVGGCKHAIVHHDRDEQVGPLVERCTIQDCDCSGLALPMSPHVVGWAS